MNAYPEYLNLNIGVRGRMGALKRAADKLNANRNRAFPDKVYTWRDVRYSGFHNAAYGCVTLTRGFNTDECGRKIPIYYTNCGQQFPRESYADEIMGYHGQKLIDHTGWYTDIVCSETARGIVVALPHGRFLAGYEWSGNGERVYYPEIYDCEQDAVYAADGHAESFARREREYDEKFNAAMKLEYEKEEKINRLRECLALRNNPCFTHLRNEAADLIKRIREIRETLKTEYADVM